MKSNCESGPIIYEIRRTLKIARKYLYPDHLQIVNSKVLTKKLGKSNGGWGDIRDHWLCMNMTVM